MYERSAVTVAGRVRGMLDLGALVAGLAAGAALLYATAGPPRLPHTLPAAVDIERFLRGSDVPWEGVGYATATAAWLLLTWMVATLGFRVLVALAIMVARGAAWARTLSAFSDRITLPLVRRVVDRALVAGMVVSLAGRASPVAADTLPPIAPMAAAHTAQAAQLGMRAVVPEQRTHGGAAGLRSTVHVVAPGENLWLLAERYYGAGTETGRIAAANAGQPMAGGATFTRPDVIHAGWALEIPALDVDVEEVDGARVYTVQPGDTLGGIAGRYLGSTERWRELFELNQYAAVTPDGMVLVRPDLIWPGLPLVLPPQEQAGETLGSDSHAQPALELVSEPAQPTAESVTAGDVAEVGAERVDGSGFDAVSHRESGDEREQEYSTPAATPPSSAVAAAPSVAAGPPLLTLVSAVAAVAGAAALVSTVGRRVRRRIQDPPIPDDEEARAALATQDTTALDVTLASRRGGFEPDPTVTISDHVCRLFQAAGVGAVAPLWATLRRTGRGVAVDIRLRTGSSTPQQLSSAAREVEVRLGCHAVARPAGARDVALSLSRLRPASLAVLGATARPVGRIAGTSPSLLPIGMAPAIGAVSINWRDIGHLLVAGGRAAARRELIAHVAASLVSRAEIGALELWSEEEECAWPAAMLELPSVRRVDASRLLQEAVAELRRRMGAQADSPPVPELVVVLSDLNRVIKDEAATDAVESIAAHGTTCGMRLLAATADPGSATDAVLGAFGTRAVFQTKDEEASVRLLGCADAADLGAPPDMLVQVCGRAPLRVRGFVASAEDLERVAATVRSSIRPRRAGVEPAQHWSETDPHETTAEGASPAMTEQAVTGAGIGAGTSAGSPDLSLIPGPGAEDMFAGETSEPQVGSMAGDEPSGARKRGLASAELGQTVSIVTGSLSAVAEPAASYATLAERSMASVPVSEPVEDEDAVEKGNSNAPSVGSMAAPPEQDREIPSPLSSVSATDRPTRLVEVRCFGHLEITVRGEPVGADGGLAGQKRPREALAYLASHPAAGVSRDKLLTALWPDASTQQASRRLTVVLTRTREVVGIPASALRCDRDGTVRLDTDVVWSDVHEFLGLLKAAKSAPPDEAKMLYASALDLYRGDLMETPECAWLDTREGGVTLREHYRELWRRAALDLAGLHVEAGDPARAVPVYRRLLHAEPALEDHVRALYRCYELLGDRTALVMEDRRLRRALRDELTDPDDPDDDPAIYQPHPDTVALYEAILDRLGRRSGVALSPKDHALTAA